MRFKRRPPWFLAFFVASLSISGCDFAKLLLAKKAPSASPSVSPGVPQFTSEAARKSMENAELLHEMVQVVLLKEPADRAEFGGLLDSLNQGASLEGIYNGLAHSAEYRKLEISHPGSSAGAVRVFSEELAFLEMELPKVSEFDSSSAQPLPQKSDMKVLATQYSQTFAGASIFTLKRVLGDEALKVVHFKKQRPESLAAWYSKWVVRLVERKVDFGIPLRNRPDEAFHHRWAAQSSEDRINWEVLNRVHRLLNEENRRKQ